MSWPRWRWTLRSTMAAAALLVWLPCSWTRAQPGPSVEVMEADEGLLVDLGLGGVDINDRAVARAFYQARPDDFDYLIIWTDFPVALAGGAASGLYLPVSGDIRGINLGMSGRLEERFDLSDEYGSGGRLKGVILLGDVRQVPANPEEPTFAEGLSALGVLGQETLHQFGAFVTYRDAEGVLRDDLLGRGGAHWSFFFHSHGSDLEGNTWEEAAPGRFVSGASGGRFSHLDQYLMGLRLPGQVTEPYFVIDAPQPVSPENINASSPARQGAEVLGQARPVTVDMIIDAHGPRLPTARDAPKVFTQAFVLLTDPRRSDAERVEARDRLDRLRRRWERYFFDAAQGRGRVVSHLDGRVELPVWNFATSDEGWAVEGARFEVGVEVERLRLLSEAPEVVLRRQGLSLDPARWTHMAMELRLEGLEAPCAVPVRLMATGSDGQTTEIASALLATDGQRHFLTAPVGPEAQALGTVEALELVVELAPAGVGALVEVSWLELVSSPSFPDRDGDGIIDGIDSCPQDANPAQVDRDGDGVGDVCGAGAVACDPLAPPRRKERHACAMVFPGAPPGTGAWLLALSLLALRRRRQI